MKQPTIKEQIHALKQQIRALESMVPINQVFVECPLYRAGSTHYYHAAVEVLLKDLGFKEGKDYFHGRTYRGKMFKSVLTHGAFKAYKKLYASLPEQFVLVVKKKINRTPARTRICSKVIFPLFPLYENNLSNLL